MDLKFNAILSVCIIPKVIEEIVNNEKIDDLAAITDFYNSKVYELLSKEETKLWHYSHKTIYMMYSDEKKYGEIIFPEG